MKVCLDSLFPNAEGNTHRFFLLLKRVQTKLKSHPIQMSYLLQLSCQVEFSETFKPKTDFCNI